MAALTGAWRAAQQDQPYSGAKVWGTGIDPIHATRDGYGRNIAPGDMPAGYVPEELTSENLSWYGYTTEDDQYTIWGYGTETGTADRPPVGTQPVERSTGDDFPHWGPYNEGIPGGTQIRAQDHGAELSYTSKTETIDAMAGFENKGTSYINDAVDSDPSQLLMNTSEVQRDKVRAGSQISGTANEYDAPIASRIVGMMNKVFASVDSYRHRDMEPYQQDMIIRPFRNRQAATGDPRWMEPNELYVSEPMQRVPVPNPYVGPEVAVDATGVDYGYTSEDVIY